MTLPVTRKHIDSGSFCFGKHDDGQCVYCSICHDFVRPNNMSEHCFGRLKTEASHRKKSDCAQCAKGKFNQEMADLRLWSFPSGYQFPDGFNFKTVLFKE